MNELRQDNNQDFLHELKYRIEQEEIIILMRSYLLKEEEERKGRGYELAAQDICLIIINASLARTKSQGTLAIAQHADLIIQPAGASRADLDLAVKVIKSIG